MTIYSINRHKQEWVSVHYIIHHIYWLLSLESLLGCAWASHLLIKTFVCLFCKRQASLCALSCTCWRLYLPKKQLLIRKYHVSLKCHWRVFQRQLQQSWFFFLVVFINVRHQENTDSYSGAMCGLRNIKYIKILLLRNTPLPQHTNRSEQQNPMDEIFSNKCVQK